jgi:hypothetical protein
MSDIKPVNIGEKTFIPLRIESSAKWKSAKISLKIMEWSLQEGVDLNSANIETVELDSTIQAPYTAYIPVTVTGEGRFDFEIHVSTEAPDGEKFRNGESSWNVFIGDFGIFSFENRVFFGGSSSLAMEGAAVENLKKTNSEYNKLLSKKEKIDKGILRQTFSEDDEEKLKIIIRKEINNIGKRFFNKDSVDPYRNIYIKSSPSSSSSMLFNTIQSVKPQKNETVTLEVNWPIDNGYTSNLSYNSFLPLHGAEIKVYDEQNNALISSGVLNNGKYSFTSPRDNLSFTAKVTAKYGNDFEVKNATDNVIEIGFYYILPYTLM